MLHHKILCLIAVTLYTCTISAQRNDSVTTMYTGDKFEKTYNKISENKAFQMLRIPVPLFAISALTYSQGNKFRTMRNTYVPNFRYHYDDFLQYAPLAAVIGMKLGGVESRSSWGRMLASDALSTTIMHREYGLTRSPLYSIGGYTVATATAFSRQLNNRHWLSDVLAGAGIGILSTELGYFLGDLIFKDKGLNLPDKIRETAPKGGRPSFLEYSVGYSIINGSIEIGKHIRLTSPGATHISVKGGYFFNPYIGIGAEITALTSPMAFDMSLYNGSSPSENYNIVRVHADPTGVFSFTGGPYFSLPVAGKLLLGTKFQTGYSHFLGNEVEMDIQEKKSPYTIKKDIAFMKGKSSNGLIMRTGISATGIINRNLGIRMYVDYDYTFLNAPYQILSNPGEEKPVYGDLHYSKHKMHYFTIGAAVTALFW